MDSGVNRRDEVWSLVHEHLTAAMIMTRLADPLEDMTAQQALEHLEDQDFDLGLVDDQEVRVVYLSELRQLGGKRLDLNVKAVAHPPRFDRLIERSLELGDVAQRLDKDQTPLLVIGHDGPDHVITTSDFTRPAGSMALLAATAALDAYLWTALSRIARADIEPLLDDKESKSWKEGRDRAANNNESLHPATYLSLGSRYRIAHELGLPERLGIDLGTQVERELIVKFRNDLAHGRPVASGGKAIRALLLTERVLDSIAQKM